MARYSLRRIREHDVAEYHVPVHAVVADVQVMLLDERDDRVNPLGIKGLGEIGIVGVAAALANAVFNATGICVRQTPITLDKLLSSHRVVGRPILKRTSLSCPHPQTFKQLLHGAGRGPVKAGSG